MVYTYYVYNRDRDEMYKYNSPAPVLMLITKFLNNIMKLNPTWNYMEDIVIDENLDTELIAEFNIKFQSSLKMIILMAKTILS